MLELRITQHPLLPNTLSPRLAQSQEKMNEQNTEAFLGLTKTRSPRSMCLSFPICAKGVEVF